MKNAGREEMSGAKELFTNFRTRALALLAIMIFVASAFFAGFTIYDSRQGALDRAQFAAENLLRAVQNGIDNVVQAYALSLDAVVDGLGDPVVQGLSEEIQQLILFDRSASAKNLGSILVLNADGEIVQDSKSRPPRRANLASRDYFRAHIDHDGALFISAPFVSVLDDQWTIALSRRVTGRDGKFAGVVVGSIKLELFKALFEELSAGPGGSIALFRTDGVSIMRTPYHAAEIGQSFSNVGVFKAFKRARAGTYDQVAVRDGVHRRYVYSQVGTLPLLISIGLSFDDILYDWNRKTLVVGSIAIALLGSMLILAFGFIRQLHRREVAEKEANISVRRFSHLAEKSTDAIVVRNLLGVRTYASERFFQMIGRSRAAVGDTALAAFLQPQSRDLVAQALQRLSTGEDCISETLECRGPDGSIIWLEAVSTRVLDQNNKLTEIITNLRNVTEQKLLEQELIAHQRQLEAENLTDALTSIPNRRAFDKALLNEGARAERGCFPLSIIMIDIDFFKSYNDHFGHVEGDETLREVGARLLSCMGRPADFVARYGGEEFAVILPDTDLAGAQHVAEGLRIAVQTLLLPHPGNPTGFVTISLGVTCKVPGSKDRGLVQAADEALYRAKSAGRNRVEVQATLLSTDPS
ncbi:MAG: diguanylate cyclase [Hyphomicrobiales bacterium]|nr:diguanylate cyclase [Hyphomicrobiales bacterium]